MQDEAVAGAPEPRSGRWSEPVPARQSAKRCPCASYGAQLSARGPPEGVHATMESMN